VQISHGGSQGRRSRGQDKRVRRLREWSPWTPHSVECGSSWAAGTGIIGVVAETGHPLYDALGPHGARRLRFATVSHGHSRPLDLGAPTRRPYHRCAAARMVRMGSPQLALAKPRRPIRLPVAAEFRRAALGPDNCGIEPPSTTIRTASDEVAGSRAPGT
jgi:hypothetical protein